MIVAGIPAYNEEKTIAKVVLLAQRHADIVVVCDDGSQDLTGDIAQKLGAIVIRHGKNMGYGAAIQSLFRKAKELDADLLVALDADGQHDAREIPILMQPILEEKADIVTGSRFLQPRNNTPLYRRFGIKVLTKMTNNSKGDGRITDGQCGFRAYNRKAIQGLALEDNGMGVSAEILMKAQKLGLKLVEVPVEVHYENLETSTHNPFSHALNVIGTIIRIVVEGRPLSYLGIPGIMLFFVGVLFGVWALQIYSLEKRLVTNVTLLSVAFTLIGTFMIFTAITLWAIVSLTQRLTKQTS